MDNTGQLPQRPKDLVYPETRFEDFYVQFDSVAELVEHPDWKNIYSNFYEFDEFEMDIPIGETIEDQNNFSTDEQLKEIIKIAHSFTYFCHRYVKILHPVHGTIPFILYKYQRTVIECYENHKYNMVSKFRQGGLTTVAVLYGLWMAMYKNDQQIYVLSKTDREALAAGDIAEKAMDNFPHWIYNTQKAEISKHEKKFSDVGSKICFYTPEAARGKSASLIIIDEAAFISGMNDHWKAMYPVVATGGCINVVSTVNGLGNWYEETYHAAQARENFFNVIDIDYWEHPIYANPDWVRVTRLNLGEKKWQQEILRDFLGSGETYISPHIIGQLNLYTKNLEIPRTTFDRWTNRNASPDWSEGALWIWKEPQDGQEYIIGVDCAEGVGDDGDNSCFQVIDASTLEQVAEFYSNLIPPHIFSQIIYQIGEYYNTALIVVENMSVGGAVLGMLQNDLAYENLYYETKKVRTNAPGVKVGVQNRSVFLETLQQRLQNNTLRINSKRFVHELKTFIFNPQKRRAEAISKKHDDAIMAMCIALYIRDEEMRGIPVGADVPDEMTKIFKTEMYQEIRKEIMEGSKQDWLSDESDDPVLPLDDELLAPVTFNIRRRHDKLLKEFGW
jgi:hypothetical protein